MPPKRGSRRDKPSSSSQLQKFQFINLGEDLQIDQREKDLIRVQAITDYHRRKKVGAPLFQTEFRSNAPSAINQTSKFRLLPKGQGFQDLSQRAQHSSAPEPELLVGPNNRLPTSSISSTRNQDVVNYPSSNSRPHHGPQLSGPIAQRRKRTDESGMQANVFSGIQDVASLELVKRLDLMAGNLEPLISLPIDASDAMRSFVHYYCKFMVFNDCAESVSDM